MKGMHRANWLICGLAVVAAGCGGGDKGYVPKQAKEPAKATIEQGQEASLFPLKEGNQWTYSVTQDMRLANNQQGSQVFELTFKVTKVEQSSQGTVGTIEVWNADKLRDRQTWIVNSTGIYQASSSILNVKTGALTSSAMNPIQPALPFPVKSGQKFKWAGTGPTMLGEVGNMTSDAEVLPAQIIDTDLGKRFSAISVLAKGKYNLKTKTGEYVTTSWYAPGVGLVRFRQEVLVKDQLLGAQTFRLKAYVVK